MMQFVYPGFLVALGFLVIPIVVHLFNFVKQKKILFSNVRFLKEVKEETQSKTKLKHLLILLARMLALACIVMAFAQPYFPNAVKTVVAGKKRVSIYIDNSFSMSALGKRGTLLDEAKSDAQAIVKSYRDNDEFQLLTNDFLGKHQHWVSKKVFGEMLNEIKISPAVRNIGEVYSRQRDLFAEANGDSRIAYFLSDFQKNFFNPASLQEDTTIHAFIVPLKGNKTSDIFIDTCWFEHPSRQLNKQEKLWVRIKNTGETEAQNLPVKLSLNQTQRAVATVNVPPGGSAETMLTFTNKTPGIFQGVLEINDYPLTFNNQLYFSFKVDNSIQVLIINQQEESPYLRKLFAVDSSFILNQTSIKQVDYSSLNKYKLIVVNGITDLSTGFTDELLKQVKKGCHLLIFPAKESNIASYNSLLSHIGIHIENVDTTRLTADVVNFKHELFQGVFDLNKMKAENLSYPKVFKHYPVVLSNKSASESLINLNNADPFLIKTPYESGCIYMCATSLLPEYSTFPMHALFVPTIINIALNAAVQQPLYHLCGENAAHELHPGQTNAEMVFHIKDKHQLHDFIVQSSYDGFNHFITVGSEIQQADNYFITGSTNDTLDVISFNYFNTESDQVFYDSENLQQQIQQLHWKSFEIIDKGVKNMTAALKAWNGGSTLWKWFVLGTLIFLALETVLIRWMKD